MSEVLEAAFHELQDTGEPDTVRERIAMRIIAAARRGVRDPARLLDAALAAQAGLRECYTLFTSPAENPSD